MAKLGQEEAVPKTRILIRKLGDALDVPTTVLVKESQHINNSALNQLHDLLAEVQEQLGV